MIGPTVAGVDKKNLPLKFRGEKLKETCRSENSPSGSVYNFAGGV